MLIRWILCLFGEVYAYLEGLMLIPARENEHKIGGGTLLKAWPTVQRRSKLFYRYILIVFLVLFLTISQYFLYDYSVFYLLLMSQRGDSLLI
ncbi:hypothetical protein CUU66_02730 [Peribacillus deserti]|uniref:Uncharacterized protein n=1 Tax=Peribacillus deserti TaxID=673318 RepID=A0A2N5MAP3_9BACI|nr:hypothetical protein CUU66_02730 [Peribacillus deserti]